MKLLEVSVENVGVVPDGVFAEVDGSARDVVVLADAVALLETIAVVLEAMRATSRAKHTLAWWARRRGPGDGRLRVRWSLAQAEAARVRGRTDALLRVAVRPTSSR
jgi:hypothetical protein